MKGDFMFRKISLSIVLCVFVTGCSQEFVDELASAILKNYLEDFTPTAAPNPALSNPEMASGYEEIAQRISSAITPMDPDVRYLAVKLAQRYPGPYNIGQVCAIWLQVKNKWKYTDDPRGQEYFASGSETFRTVGGDCDDFAIFIASLVESIGGTTRIVLGYNKISGHAYPEVYMAKTQSDAKAFTEALGQLFGTPRGTSYFYHKAKNGYWLNLDWSANHPGGPFFKATREVYVYPDGRWHL